MIGNFLKKNIKYNEVREAKNDKILCSVTKQLTEYFNGERKVFNIPFKLYGTNFQVEAWKKLRIIQYGRTISYQEQAIMLGDKKKARAVGMANNKNPIPIIIPCHRVISKSGDISGYGAGISNKKYLLELEYSFFCKRT